jgi:hypothetical protein
MQITKASGQPEEFNDKKLLSSLKAAGVPDDVGKGALRLVKDRLSSDTDTNKIHKLVSQYLNQHANPLSLANYNLKRALFKLGPTGYPFEQFFAKVLQELGFNTKVGAILEGKCVKHEIDVVAKKDNQVFYIECKFHNRPGLKTDVQVALYTHARFNDIESSVVEVDHPKGVQPPQEHYSWLVSNTKITKEAIKYADCQNIKTTSWSHPRKESLFNLIVSSKLHPITVLNSLSTDQMEILLKQEIVILKDFVGLIGNNQLTNLLSKEDIKKVKAEANAIYQ